MEAPRHKCSACPKPAECFCTCATVEALFCEACFFAHFQASRSKQHSTYPAASLPHFKEEGYLERLQARTVTLPQVRELTLRNLGDVEKCIGELTAEKEKLTKYYIETVEMLSLKKREIEASLQEVEATITEDHPDLASPHSKAMRAYLDRKSTSFELFEYRLNAVDPKHLLDIRSQRCSLYEPRKFPVIFGNSLRLYDLVWKEFTSFTLSVKFTTGTVFCLMDKTKVLCVGSDPASNAVYSLNTSDQQLTAMANLNAPRLYPGTIKVGSFVYTFGSYSPNLASCEKFSLGSNWTNLSDMNAPRLAYHPAVYLNDIYLGDPQGGNRSIQVFNIERETFRVLPFPIPANIPNHIHAFVIAGELYMPGDGYMGRWKIGSTAEMQATAINGGFRFYSNCPAFVVGREVYRVNYSTGALIQLNYETNCITNL